MANKSETEIDNETSRYDGVSLCLLTPGLELRHSGAQVIYNWATKNQHPALT